MIKEVAMFGELITTKAKGTSNKNDFPYFKSRGLVRKWVLFYASLVSTKYKTGQARSGSIIAFTLEMKFD